ncbi:ankyrin repeat-containing domain protein [Haematococcus lacustris]
MPVEDLIKDIEANPPKLKSLQEKLRKEKPNVKFFPVKGSKDSWCTPLHVAARAGGLQCVQALLTASADVHALDHEGATPLHWAAASLHRDAPAITGLLLQKGAKPDAVTQQQRTPLHLAAAQGRAAVIPVLAAAVGAAGLSCQSGGSSPLVAAAAAGRLEAVDALLAAGCRLGAPEPSGLTPLMHLIQAGRCKEARLLLSRGDCCVNARGPGPQGHTALMMAVMGGAAGSPPDLALVDALLDSGASPDMQEEGSGNTPIMHAISHGHDGTAIRMIKSAKQINVRNAAQLTALSLALASAAPDALVGAVLAAGADLGQDGRQLLSSALDSRRDGLVAEFIKVLKPEVLQALGLSFRRLAELQLVEASLAWVKRFQREQTDELAMDADGNTNLHLLAEHGGPLDLVLGLIRLGLGPDTTNKAGDTPLHIAARAGHVEVCRALLAGGADCLKRNGKNRRPREQPKIPDATRDFLAQAEEEAKIRKANKQSELWDEKMRATQTESAVIIRGL